MKGKRTRRRVVVGDRTYTSHTLHSASWQRVGFQAGWQPEAVGALLSRIHELEAGADPGLHARVVQLEDKLTQARRQLRAAKAKADQAEALEEQVAAADHYTAGLEARHRDACRAADMLRDALDNLIGAVGANLPADVWQTRLVETAMAAREVCDRIDRAGLASGVAH